MHPTWPYEELCAIVGQRVRDLIRATVGTDSDRAASSLLSRLQQKQERWEDVVNSIDFSHSSRKAWRTSNKLTGRYGCSSHLCPVSANSITSQLMKNVAHRTGGRESTRLVNKQLSEQWKIPTPEGHSITETFRPEELAAALRLLKPGKSRHWIPSSRSLYSMSNRLSNLGFVTSLRSTCANSQFQISGEEH